MAQARPLPPIPLSGELHSRLDGVALRNARSNLLEAIRESRHIEFADLLNMDVTQKYKLVDARSAMSAGDKKSTEDIRRSCLFLRNKLKHLLNPVNTRPADWDKVQATFCECLPGVDQLLERIGFVRNGSNYTIAQDRLSNEALVEGLVDLYLLAEELSLIVKDKHPLGNKLLAKNEPPVVKRVGPASGMHEMVSMMQRKLSQVCDLCGDASATVACQESHCSKRRLCENCDKRWHGHPDRRAHIRRKISEVAGANAVRVLPAGPVQLNSGVIKVVSNSQAVSYMSQLGLPASKNLARPQQQPHQASVASKVPPQVPPKVPPHPVAEAKTPLDSPREQRLQKRRQQQQPAPPSGPSESDARVMKLNEFMMSLKPIEDNQRSVSQPANDIIRPPSPEEEFHDCLEQLPPVLPPKPQPPSLVPKPKPRLSKSIVEPSKPLEHFPKPLSNEVTEANSWSCPTCTALNPISETKVLKSNRVVCSVCAVTCDDRDIVAKVKEQQQQRPVMNNEVSKEPVFPDRVQEKPPLAPISDVQEWSCSACTMFNPNSVKACTICDTPREIGIGEILTLPFKVKPVALRHIDPKLEYELSRQLLKLLHDIEVSGSDGRLAQLYLVATADEQAQSEAGFQTWQANEWLALVEKVGHEVVKVLHGINPGVAALDMRPSFDDIASAVLESTCDLETAIQLCAQRHVAKISWIAEHCPELLQTGEVNIDLQGDLTAIFQAENERALRDFAQFLFSKEGAEAPKFDKMNGSEASLHCLMGEFNLRKISDAQIFYQLMRSNEFRDYSPEDLVEAAKGCNGRHDYIDFVKSYLSCECKTCSGTFPKHKLLPMASCQCEFCHECFHTFVESVIKGGGHVTDLHCPMCGIPNANQIEELESHFGMLLPQIKQFQCFENSEYHFDETVVDLVEKKITEWNLFRDPNFRWCSQCGTGLVLGEIMLGLKFQCPDCLNFTCMECKKPWKDQHEGIDCEQFEEWLRDNDPEYQEKGVGFFLQVNGIQCPSCHFQYALAKGGCLHFTCRQCRFQFCAGCDGEYQIIQGRGLTCKHPRDCLFYLRDYGVRRLQQLLQANQIEFESIVEAPVDNCEVMEQKERDGGLIDEACGVKVNPGQANLCEKHYIEYLVSLVNKHRLDPVSVMDDGELRAACGRHGIDCSRVGANNEAALRALITEREPLVKEK